MTKEEAIEIIKKDMSNIMADENTFRRQYDLHQAEAFALQALSNEILVSFANSNQSILTEISSKKRNKI